MSVGSVDNTLRLLLVTRSSELEQELRGLRFLLWRASPKAKAVLGNIVKRTLPLHDEELMKSPVEDLLSIGKRRSFLQDMMGWMIGK
jgi:hypothetical protein